MYGLRKIRGFFGYPKMNYANFAYNPSLLVSKIWCVNYANFAESAVIIGGWCEICSVCDQLFIISYKRLTKTTMGLS